MGEANELYNAAGGYGEIEKKIVKYSPGAKTNRESVWTPIHLINMFRELNKLSFFASSARWLKTRELRKVQAPNFPFTPAINPQSQVIAEAHLKKYLETSLRHAIQ